MTKNQEEIENNFHGKRVMYGGFGLLHHSLLIAIITEGKNNALGYLLH